MRISCHNCHQIWEVPSENALAGRLRFALGSDEHAFICPNCQAENVLTKWDFETHDAQIPVTGKQTEMEPSIKKHPPRADNDPASPPTNPVPVPEPSPRELHAIVLDQGLKLRREHNRMAEIMGELKREEHVIILDTWTDGEDIWIQLGPERWATVQEEGEALIQLLDE